MKVAILYEKSGRVRDAFIKHGHESISCDKMPSHTVGPHYRGDVRKFVKENPDFDLWICFPPCQFLTNSNAWRWEKIAEERDSALEDIRWLLGLPGKVAIENPAGAITKAIRPPDQYIEPWQFGEPWQKKTGLWLKGLPLLEPYVTIKGPNVRPWVDAGYSRKRYPDMKGKRDSKSRGITFKSIARAMAEQWG